MSSTKSSSLVIEPATKNEIKLAVQAVMARNAVGWLYDQYVKLMSPKRKYTRERRRLATIRTYITEVTALILAQGSEEERRSSLQKVQDSYDRSMHLCRVAIDWGEPLEKPAQDWFSSYALTYCALRDIIVYFERHPDRLDGPTSDFENARKELLKRSRNALSTLKNLFQEEVQYGLNTHWEHLEHQLQNEIKPYRFEARVVGV